VQRMTGCIPVSDANSTRTIYSRPMYNYAFRAWHDMLHVVSGEVFDIHGELAVASLQDHILRLANIPEPDIAAIYADTAGQAHYYSIHGNFPMDQRGFVLAYVTHGAEHALHTWRDSVNG
jgi:ubiquinone biosynthesis protein Coq4